jgi:peroxiredoxin
LGTDRQKKIVILFSLLILVMGFWLIFLKSDRIGSVTRPPGWKPKVTEAAPDFHLPNLDGNLVRLADFKGKVIFLNFWATWCPPCIQEMPWMETLYRSLKGREFEMLAVSIDEDGKKAVRPFMEKYSLTLPVLVDHDKKVAALYGITGIPETFIINKQGVVDLKIIGPQNWTGKRWRDYFDILVGETREAPLPAKKPIRAPWGLISPPKRKNPRGNILSVLPLGTFGCQYRTHLDGSTWMMQVSGLNLRRVGSPWAMLVRGPEEMYVRQNHGAWHIPPRLPLGYPSSLA